MRQRRSLTLAALVGLVGALFFAAPAAAAPQPGLGTTVDAVIYPSGQSGLGETVWLPSSTSTLVASTVDPVLATTVVELWEGATLLATCDIPVTATGCSDTIPALSSGAHSVEYTFSSTAGTATFSGTLFTITEPTPTVTIEWQDAGGNWIDGSGIGVPLFATATTTGVCVITNLSNAPVTFNSAEVTVFHPSGPETVLPITGTLEAGAQLAFEFYAGPVSGVSGVSCSVGVLFAGGFSGGGNGDGGGVIPITGTLTASPLSVAPGDTITVTGTNVDPPLFEEIRVLLDGAPAPGSPTGLTMPGGILDFDVVIPTTATAGTHTIAVQGYYNAGQRYVLVTLATFTVTVSGGLAATGVENLTAPGLIAVALLLGGALLLVRRRLATR